MSEPQLQPSRGVWADDFIGSLLDQNAVVYYLEEGFNPELLPKEEARAIWHFVREYFEESARKSVPTLEVLTTKFPTWRFVEPKAEPHWLVQQLKDQWKQHQTQLLIYSAAKMEPDEVYVYLKNKVFEMEAALETERNTFGVEDWPEMWDKYLARLDAGGIKGYTSGFPEVDAEVGGFKPTQLIIINGRLKTGKTWFGLKAWLEQRKQGLNPIFFSMELSLEEIYIRILAIMSGISADAIDKERVDPNDIKKLAAAQEEYGKLGPGWVIQPEPGSRKVTDLLSFADKYDSKSIIVDQLENLESTKSVKDFGGRHDLAVGWLARELKLAAQRPSRPLVVYAMHQFSRQQTKDGDLDSRNMANSDQVAREADLVFGLQQTDEMFEANQIKLEVMEARSTRKKEYWICDFEFYDKTVIEVAPNGGKTDFDQATELLTLSNGAKVNAETGELVGSVQT